MRKIQIDLPSSGLVLEACLDLPAVSGPFPGVVLCHPHPLYGGDMNNNVILAISRSLTGKGIASLRFNFRGVGRSQGCFANGIGEQEDAQAALLLLSNREEIDPSRIGIMGYSFGGMVALAVGDTNNVVRAIAAVSPVIPADVLKQCAKPKLIVTGAEDNIITPSSVLKETAGMAEPKIVEVIAGVDHFWWGYEARVGEMVADFFARVLAIR
ncbi:MAG: alpha/beta hydrolase [Desulfofundulus sp.]